jgi:hypothetical protein
MSYAASGRWVVLYQGVWCGHVCAAVAWRAGGSHVRCLRAGGAWLAYARGSLRAARCSHMHATRGSLCSGREGALRVRRLALIGDRQGPVRAPGRSSGPHGRSLGERPRRSATPPPAPYLRCRDYRAPEGSCAGAPFRSWLQQRRLRSPAHCVGTRSRRLSVRRGHGGATLSARGAHLLARGGAALG